MIDVKEIFTHGMREDVAARPVSGGIPGSVWQAYSAFANTSGGIILLGAEEKKDTGMYLPRGVHTPERLMLDLGTALSDRRRVSANILFEDRIYPVSFEGVTIIVIEVPRALRHQQPVFVGTDVFMGTYLRIHGENVLCGRDRILSMMQNQDPCGTDGKLYWRYRLDSLSEDTVARYRAVFDSRRQGHPYQKMGNEEFLVRIGAAARNEERRLCPSQAGLLFFGSREVLKKEFPYVFLDYRELSAETHSWVNRVSTRDPHWTGNLFDFYCRIIDRLTALSVFEPGNSGPLEEKKSVLFGIEEVLVNALIHADYAQGTGILIDKGERWITISNPGTLLCDPAYALAGGVSQTRNARIKGLFSLIGIGASEGEGLSGTYSSWERAGWQPPKLIESFEAARTSLMLPLQKDPPDCSGKGKETEEGEEKAAPASQGMNSAKARALVAFPEYPTDLDFSVYGCLCAGYAQSEKDLSRFLSQSEERIERSLRHLKELGFIRRLGTTLGGWETTELRDY